MSDQLVQAPQSSIPFRIHVYNLEYINILDLYQIVLLLLKINNTNKILEVGAL